MHLREFPSLIKATAKEWSEDKASRHAAALSYYTIFSIAPLLLIAIAVAGAVFGEEAARGRITAELGGLLGREGAKTVETMVEAASKPKDGIIASVFGLLALLFGASGVFGQLQDSLNSLWEVRPRPGRGIKGMLKPRLLSLSMVFVIAFLLLVSMVLGAAVSAATAWFGQAIPGQDFLLHAADIVLSMGMAVLIFASLFKVLPDARIRWSDVWTGALVTAFLFTVGRFLIGLYLGRSSVGSAYGAAGSLVIVLLWVYYSSQILFFGAEFTQVYASRFGSRVVPETGAQAVTKPRPLQGKPALDPGVASQAAARPASSAKQKASASREGEGGVETVGLGPRGRAYARGAAKGAVRRAARGRLGSAAFALSLALVTGGSALRNLLRRVRRA